MGSARSPFRDFESYLRTVVGLDEDDIWLVLNQYNANFVTYEITPGIYTVKDFSEAVYTTGDHKGTLRVEYDDISVKTKLLLKQFGGSFGALRFDKRSFKSLSGSTPYWDYKPSNAFHADNPAVYASEKNSNLSKEEKIQLKCDLIDGSIVNGLRQHKRIKSFLRA